MPQLRTPSRSRVPKCLKRIVSGINQSTGMVETKPTHISIKLYRRILHCLANFWRRGKFRAKDDIPEAAGNSEAVLIVHEVVLKVVLF